MAIEAKYVFVVTMDVDPDKEALFNEVYDTEHVPLLLKVPGVRAAKRMSGVDFTIMLGGEALAKTHQGARYLALYEIDHPDVLKSAAWAEAGEKGRWPKEVRPFTRNRGHAVYKVRD